MSEEVDVEVSEFFVEVEPMPADGTGEAGFAPAVDAVAVVAVPAGSRADLVQRLKLQQADRTCLALLFCL